MKHIKEYDQLIFLLKSKFKTQYYKVLITKYHFLLDYLNSISDRNEFKQLSVKTKIYWLLNNLEDFPKCKKCGKEIIRNIASWKNPKYSYCSEYCAHHCKLTRINAVKTIKKHERENPNFWKDRAEKVKQTNLKNCGYEWYLQDKEYSKQIVQKKKDRFGNGNNFEKVKKTKFLKYGNQFYTNSAKREQTCIKKYGSKTPLECHEIYNKTQDSFKKHHPGYINALQLPEIRSLMLERKDEIVKKRINTRRIRHNFNTSKPEQRIFTKFIKIFGQDDICLNWNKDKRYPYMVDIYIKSLDIFIECNFHWTHGGHWFNCNDERDIKRLNFLKERYIQKTTENPNKHNLYEIAIYVWTKLDVMKRKTASDNHLKYIVFWNEEDAEKWLNLNKK